MESGNVSQFRNTTVTSRNLNGTLCNTTTDVEGKSLRLVSIRFYACFTAFTLCFLALCGSLRRRKHSAVVRYAIKGAYLHTTSLVSYTIGQMQSAQFRNELFAVWGVFFGVAFGCIDTITVFSLDENEKTLEYIIRYLVQSFWIGWLIGTYDQEAPFSFKPLVFVLFGLTFLRGADQHAAMNLACKYSLILESKIIMLRIVEVISVIIGFWFAGRTIRSYFITCGYHNVDVLVTGIIILPIVIVEIVQVVFRIYSDWLKLLLLCKYVTKPEWQEEGIIEEVIRYICRLKRFKPWERKLGQYSLLKSLQSANIFVKAYTYAITRVEDKERRGIVEERRINLPVQVKKAVANSLRGLKNRKLTNGVTSLNKYVENGVIEPAWKEEILQACSLETQTQVILVWHIATSLCENQYLKERRPISDAFITATSLSNYCAYLVAFAPQLLPDNVRTTEVIFHRVVFELKQYFQRCNMSLTELYRQLQNENMNTITEKGVRLACLLAQIHQVDSRWKVLADFWVELMLFLSPSDDYNAHAEYLAMGGEFITHLWALLSHAGILHRPSSEPQEQQQTATKATTQERTSEV